MLKPFKAVTGLSLKKPTDDPIVRQYLIDNKADTLPSLLKDYNVRDFGIWREENSFGLGLTLQHKRSPITSDSLKALRDLLSTTLGTSTVIPHDDAAYVIAGREPSKFRAPSSC